MLYVVVAILIFGLFFGFELYRRNSLIKRQFNSVETRLSYCFYESLGNALIGIMIVGLDFLLIWGFIEIMKVDLDIIKCLGLIAYYFIASWLIIVGIYAVFIRKIAKIVKSIEPFLLVNSKLRIITSVNDAKVSDLWRKMLCIVPLLIIYCMIENPMNIYDMFSDVKPVQYEGNNTIFSQILQEVANTEALVKSTRYNLLSVTEKLYNMLQIGIYSILAILAWVLYRIR